MSVTDHCSYTAESGLEVICFRSMEQLEPIRSQIDSLASHPFLKSTWMFPWIQTFCSGTCRLDFLLVRDQSGTLVGFAPLVVRHSVKRSTHIGFVGSGKACADYMTFPCRPGFEAEFIDAIVGWFFENRETWDRIELDGVVANDEVIKRFGAKMATLDFQVEAIATMPSFRLELPESWSQLLDSLSKNSRKKFRRLDRKIASHGRFHVASDRDSLKTGLRILEQLHTARWNSLGEPGCYSYHGFREFLNNTAIEKFDRQKLSLIWLTWKDTPIAADIAWRDEKGFYSYQGGISPDHLELEPGWAILKHQIERAIDSGARFVDFLRGDEAYKSRFKSERTDNVRYEIVGESLRAKLTQTCLQLGRSTREVLEHIRG